MTILAARDISISFGGIKAIDGVSFAVSPGKILSIIGPNGAGKTTLFNIVSGVYERDQGRIELSGEDVTGLTPDKLAARGLSRTFQNLQIFQRMTAAENVMVGRHLRERCSLFADMFRLPSVTRQNSETREAALALLDDVGLKSSADASAGSLSYGACKRLEIARALAQISANSASRAFGVSALESSTHGGGFLRSSTTIAAQTGPASGPRPTSSMPATRRRAARGNSSSCLKSGTTALLTPGRIRGGFDRTQITRSARRRNPAR